MEMGYYVARTCQADPERFAESFLGLLRDESLNDIVFASLAGPAGKMDDYNRTRPHSRLGNVLPAIYRTSKETIDGS
jgi:transposase InsO family protein